ncbi:MAG: outer membrane protein assembly factor BamA, partial [Alloprevotella sp.]|nr:outer membrane protein assembly factor BamA [Alloprevotella sp.]
DALITNDSVQTVDDAHVNIFLDLHKGQKYYLRNIDWVGNTVYPTALLEELLQMKSGDVYDQTLLNKRLNVDDSSVGNRYYNNGYVFNRIEPVEINIVNDSVDLEIRIREGRQATFNHVNISGNDRVYENVVRRELYTKPGDLFSMEAIKRSVMNINQMQQFDAEALGSALNRSIKPDEANGTVDISYPLVGKGGDQFQVSAGWGPTGIVGTIGVKFTNFSMRNLFGKGNKRAGILPQGDGQTLAINAQTNGTYYQSYSVSFLDPWFGGKRPNQLSLSLYFNKQSDVSSRYYNNAYYNNLANYYYYGGLGNNNSYYNYTNYYDPDKYVKMIGLSLGFGKRLRWPDDHFSFMAELSYTRYMLKNWQYFDLISNGDCNNLNLTLSINRSSVDNLFYPRGGSEFSLSATLTPPYSLWNGKDYKNLATDYRSSTYQKEAQEKYRWIEYHKWKFKLRTFTALMNVAKAPVLMTRVEFGLLGSYNRHYKSPFETYYVGGDGMSGYTYGYATETIGLRGYDNGAIAGNNGNNAYAYSRMTLELRYPLMLEGQTNIFALAFAEGGNAWTDTKKFNPFDMKRSAGVGVRLMLPMIGMLGIDWAYGFQKYINGTKAGGSQVHFILNQEF